MSENLTENLSPKKKLRWYWWVLIVIVGLNVVGKLAGGDDPVVQENTAVTTEIKAEPVEKQLTTKQVDEILAGLRKEKDEFQKISFYYSKSSSKYNNVNALYLYLSRTESNSVYPRLKIQYAGDNWLFLQSYHFLIDENKMTILAEAVETDNDGSGVWEVMDKSPTSVDLLILNEVANGKVVKLRYEGKDKIYDRVITEKEKNALKIMLATYEKLK